MTKVFNRARMSTNTTGTGTVTLDSAVTGFATFAEAGVSDADEVAYVIEEGNDFEIGIGTYTASGTTLSRDTVRLSKIGGTAGTSKMNLGGTAEVFISPLAEELVGYGSGKTINQPLFDSYADFSEISAPSNPAADTMRAYARDDGAGNTEMVLLDSAGNEIVLSGGAVDRQVFTSSDTWNKPASGTVALIEVWAGGGGARNAASNDGGGGGGGYNRMVLPLSDLGSSETVTVGAGGSTGSPPSPGGNSSFGTHVSAFGGGAGGQNSGGGGGGQTSAGEDDGGAGGRPFAGAADGGHGNTGGGGGGGDGAGDGLFGGGGGGDQNIDGGQSLYGGGGGAGGDGATGGQSVNGGDGGDSGAAGNAPGGGGGRASDGARGEVRVTVW